MHTPPQVASPSPGALRRAGVCHRGFTLIELLTVIVIIGVLAAILLPVIGRVRESAKQSICRSNLRQIGLATASYAAERRGMLPLILDEQEQRWAIQLKPHLGEATYGVPITGTSQGGSGGGGVFVCGSDDVERTGTYATQDRCSYGMNRDVQNINTAIKTRKSLNTLSRPSRTILYADLWDTANSTAHSLSLGVVNIASGTGGDFIKNYHQGKASNFAFADGHVESLSRAEALDVSQKMMAVQ